MKKTDIIRKRVSANKGRFRLAIVGMGLRGVLMVENIRKSVPDIEIVALVDTIGERAELAKDYFGLEVPVYADVDSCLDEVAPEGVAVFTQDAFHVAPVVKVLTLKGVPTCGSKHIGCCPSLTVTKIYDLLEKKKE